ncbi:MAG: tetratricopeptide repeat protein [Verrucomicrobiota bacterium]
MAVLRRWILSVSLLLAAEPLLAAEVPGETGAFNSAFRQLHDSFWQQAEAGFAEFSRKFANSARLPEAFLYQALARYQMSNYDGAIDLLLAHQGQAGRWADQYLLWLGQASLKKGDYPAAGGAFSNLVSQFRDSSCRIEAAIGEATAWAKRQDWPRVIELLQKPEGVFQSAARTNSASDVVQSGCLLLAEGLFARGDYAAADATLESLARVQMNPKLAWQRQLLLCRIRLAQGRPESALPYTTNLLGAARASADRGLLAESFAFQGDLFERLGRGDDALLVYTNNLAAGTPAERQRQALEKITGFLLARDKLAQAAQTLEEFSTNNPSAPPADFALLMLGELRLRQQAAASATNRVAITATNAPALNTNLLGAIKALTDLVKKFPQSPLLGRGQLDLGWCLWQQRDWAGCQAACQAALDRLPPSLDQATARFKLADAQFEQKNFPGALTNYSALVERYANLPEVKTNLFEPALYQAVRAGLDGGDLAAASNALSKILAWFPNGFHTEGATLLAAQAISRHGNPAAARDLFSRFAQRAPDPQLLPRMSLAVVRTYEQENKLPEAIRECARWLERYTNSTARPQAEYSLALDYSLSGNETNAFLLFTNFIAHFPTNEFTPLALWWIGSCHFNNHAYLEAERTFKLIFDTNFPPSELSYPARMMAGRAAFLLADWKVAINYFTNLINDAPYPGDLRLQAMFAYGDTLMSQESTNRVEDYGTAIQIFGRICQDYPTNRQVFLAYGQKALCHLQWASLTHQYDDLTNALQACQHVIDMTNADVNARSMALVGQAVVLQKQAEQKTGPEKKALLESALNKYMAVFYDKNLREGEQAESFWVKKAGLDLAALLTEPGEVQNWPQALNVYGDLKKRLPVLGPSLDAKILNLDAKILKARERAGGP